MVVTSLNNSVASNLDSCTNWKSPTSLRDFLKILTLATSPTKVFNCWISILANEPVNDESDTVCPSTYSNDEVYPIESKFCTMLLIEYGISTNTSLLFKTSLTVGEYPNDGMLIMFSSIEDVNELSSVIFNL